MKTPEKNMHDQFTKGLLNQMAQTKKVLNKALRAVDELSESNYKQNRGTAFFNITVALNNLERLEAMAEIAKTHDLGAFEALTANE